MELWSKFALATFGSERVNVLSDWFSNISFIIFVVVCLLIFFLQMDGTRKNDHNQLFTTLQYTTEKKNYPFVKPNVYYFTVGSAVG